MRILQVYHIYPAIFGGVSRVVHDVTRELYRKGHKVSVLTTDYYYRDVKAIEIENNNGIEILRVPTILRKFTRTNNMALSQPFSLAYLVKNVIKNFDVIHFHGHRSYQKVVVHYYAKKYHVPYIVQAHGDLPRIMAKQRLKWIFDVFFGYRLLRDASKVIALSRTEAEQYKGMGVPEEKIEVIPNGIDLSEYADLPPEGSFKQKFGISEDERIVLYLGRIHRIKGIDVIAKAFADVIKKLDDVRLVVVGPDDGYLGELEALIKTLKIEDNVLISCPLYGKDKIEAFVDADVYVLVSRYETFPMTVLEAVACETPIILTENCGIAEYIKDKVGLIVKPDSNRVREALIEVLLNQDRQNTFRKNRRSVKEKFDISKTISKLEGVYEEALSMKVDL